MGATTKIAWTDSTWNAWWGCQKVGPGCDHCYAEAVDKRAGGGHWGPGAPRRPTSQHNLNEPHRWQRKADAFLAEHGRARRVFCGSMMDIMDNAVPLTMSHQAFRIIEDCDRLSWQLLTKRVGNTEKRVPGHWLDGRWPRHAGLMITVVNQVEALRDVPKLTELKERCGIPWVGVSYEPAVAAIDWGWVSGSECLDWIIFGGESGASWRPTNLHWAYHTADWCAFAGIAFFMKQVAAFRPRDDMIPADLMIREFPRRAA